MPKILITGGAGFIGCNASASFAKDGWEVAVFDNLSRKGTDVNLEWLRMSAKVDFIRGDVRDPVSIEDAVRAARPDVILHLAAQVAVTTSVTNPREDFEINALGTLNVLEAARLSGLMPLVIYASTNKVYGGMESVGVTERNGRYEYADLPEGVSEEMPLDFHSPYGCSKGAADQYAHDYSRIYGIPTVVMRQSCIYGPRQFGIEDQGWVAWFTIAATMDKTLTIFGDGKQIRDVLHVDDLISAYKACIARRGDSLGRIYNIGGGPQFTMSLLELVRMLNAQTGRSVEPAFSDWRPGDQRVFVSGIERAKRDLKWEPRISIPQGVEGLIDWVRQHHSEIDKVL